MSLSEILILLLVWGESACTSNTEWDATTILTTTNDPCVISAYTNFSCTERGRFKNPNDALCNSYFMCSRLRNGSYIKTKYSCPNGSWFDSDISICTTETTCPCQSETTVSLHTTVPSLTSTTFSITYTTTIENTTNMQSPNTTLATTTESLQTLSSTTKLIKTTVNPEVTTNAESSSPSTPSISTSELTTIVASTTTKSTTETTTESCVYNDNPEYFSCSSKGRFANLNDASCQSYFLCNLLRGDTLGFTKYTCPETSYFNPTLQVCDVNYICPCVEVTETTVSTEAILTTTESLSNNTELIETTLSPELTTNAVSPSSSTLSTVTPELTTIVASTTIKATTETTAESCAYNANPEYFSCSSKGRFANLNDASCQSYFLCNLLRSGSYLKTKYACPETSYFNPTLQVCHVNYICPCVEVTETTVSTEGTTDTDGSHSPTITEMTETTLSLGLTTDAESPPLSTFSIAAPELTTTVTLTPTKSSTETTAESCVYNSDAEYFSCSSKGRFANLNDASCQSYFLCNLLRSGSYLKTKYTCPETSYFNPTLQVCDVSYICPCVEVTETSDSTEATTTTESLSNKTGLIETTLSPELTTNAESPSSDTLSTATSELMTTVASTTTKTTTETTAETCAYNANPEYFSCSSKGRFANLNDASCQSYFLCNLLRSGSYLKTKYTCPETSYFHPTLQVCDVNYICPCVEVTDTTVSTDGTTDTDGSLSPTTTDMTETTLSPGLTTDAESPSLSTFSIAAPELTTTVTLTPTKFSTETTAESCIYNSDEEYFSCSSKGRFANLNDVSCQTYFLCNLLRSGSYLKTKYTCPETSYFNPTLQACDVNYVCPCFVVTEISVSTEVNTTTESLSNETGLIETTLSPELTTNGESPSTATPELITTVASTTIKVTTETTAETCAYNANPEYFSCSSKGRFANLNDASCQSYFLCNLLRSGSYLKTKYTCPETSYFNPTLQVCDVNYICPCVEVTDTSVSTQGTTQTDGSLSPTTTDMTETTLSPGLATDAESPSLSTFSIAAPELTTTVEVTPTVLTDATTDTESRSPTTADMSESTLSSELTANAESSSSTTTISSSGILVFILRFS